jgi:hypothetical protein
MAKKSYQRVNAGQVNITSFNDSKSEIEINGQNKNGTKVRIKVFIDDWYLPQMIKEMARIGRRRLQAATDLNKRITTSVNE